MDIPIGQIIREEVDRQGMTIDEFAKRISTSRTNAYDIFNRLSIDMELLGIAGASSRKRIRWHRIF